MTLVAHGTTRHWSRPTGALPEIVHFHSGSAVRRLSDQPAGADRPALDERAFASVPRAPSGGSATSPLNRPRGSTSAWPVDDQRLRELLDGRCHEVLKPAGFLSVAQVGATGDGRETAAVFCGDPKVFAERHAALMPDYGPDGALCVDVWVHVVWAEGRVRASVEGTDVSEWLHQRGLDEDALAIEEAPGLSEAMAAVTGGLALMLRRSDG